MTVAFSPSTAASLAALIEELGLVGLIVADTHGRELFRSGLWGRLDSTGLLDRLFGGQSEVCNVVAHLETQELLPRGFGQGDDSCVVSLADGFVYGAFLKEDRDVFARHRRRSAIAARIETVLLGSTGGDEGGSA